MNMRDWPTTTDPHWEIINHLTAEPSSAGNPAPCTNHPRHTLQNHPPPPPAPAHPSRMMSAATLQKLLRKSPSTMAESWQQPPGLNSPQIQVWLSYIQERKKRLGATERCWHKWDYLFGPEHGTGEVYPLECMNFLCTFCLMMKMYI